LGNPAEMNENGLVGLIEEREEEETTRSSEKRKTKDARKGRGRNT
jgi:hypothetical protein